MAFEQRGNETFWKMHDLIMQSPQRLEIRDLRGYAGDLGMAINQFDEVMADESKMDKLISEDMADAKKCKVSGTPTIFINGRRMQNLSIREYQKRIDEILENKP